MTEEPSPGADGARWSHTPTLGIHHAVDRRPRGRPRRRGPGARGDAQASGGDPGCSLHELDRVLGRGLGRGARAVPVRRRRGTGPLAPPRRLTDRRTGRSPFDRPCRAAGSSWVIRPRRRSSAGRPLTVVGHGPRATRSARTRTMSAPTMTMAAATGRRGCSRTSAPAARSGAARPGAARGTANRRPALAWSAAPSSAPLSLAPLAATVLSVARPSDAADLLHGVEHRRGDAGVLRGHTAQAVSVIGTKVRPRPTARMMIHGQQARGVASVGLELGEPEHARVAASRLPTPEIQRGSTLTSGWRRSARRRRCRREREEREAGLQRAVAQHLLDVQAEEVEHREHRGADDQHTANDVRGCGRRGCGSA